MQMRSIGSLMVPVIGLGTNNFGYRMGPAEPPPVVHAALDAGLTFFDTADIYGNSERRLGDALVGRRDEAIIATKFGCAYDGLKGGATPAYVRSAVERSLSELGTDYIDLYILHQPDPTTPIADTLDAMNRLVDAGKVREIGCSNFSEAQLREADAAASGARFVSVQNHYSLLHRDDEADVMPYCAERGIGYVPFYPLANGLLSGKYRRGEPPPAGTRLQKMGERAQKWMVDENFDAVERLTAWAADHGHTVAELAIAWLIAHPEVSSVIAGAMTPAQVYANAAAANWVLSPAEVAEVAALT